MSSENTRGSQGTPTPSGSHHPSVSNLRVTPSPAGSAGSRSNTPASVTGNQAGSPMPPRPPSSQLDGQGSMSQSQMTGQGFGQHIMPPPVGPNQMYNTANKPMAGMNAVAASVSQMGGHFSQYNSQFPGSFHRQQNPAGMQNYPQQNVYNGPNQMSSLSGGSLYSSMPINRNMSSANYNSASYPQSGNMNSQCSNFNSHSSTAVSGGPNVHGGPCSNMPNHSMNSMQQQQQQQASPLPSHPHPPHPSTGGANTMTMSPSGQCVTPPIVPGVKGAHAAAQAAMIAAANTAAATRCHQLRTGSSNQPARMYPPGMAPAGPSSSHIGSMNFSSAINNIPSSSGQFPSSVSQTTVPNSMTQQSNSCSPTSPSTSSTHSSNTTSANSNRTLDPMKQTPSSLSKEGCLPSNCASSFSAMIPPTANSGMDGIGIPTQGDSTEEGKAVDENSECNSDGSRIIPPGSLDSSGVVGPTVSSSMSTRHSSAAGPATSSSVPVSQHVCVSSQAPSSNNLSLEDSHNTTTSTANSSAGNTATMVTQAITAPVASVVESMSNDSQPDLLSTYSIPPMVNSSSSGNVMSSDEPPEKKKKDCVSHPPTPTNLSQSPSGTSVSSYPEEIENLNSPTSWSVGTPKPGQTADLHKLYTMGDEPDRKTFLDRLLYFLEEKGTPITSMPQISKQPLDLYKLYHSVKDRGGMVEVSKAKKWKEICAVVNIGSSASAAFTLKKNYVRYLFAMECKYDKGGIDPAPILAQMEAAMQQKRESKQRRAPSPAGSQGSSQDAFRPPSTPNSNSQGMDPFSPNMQSYIGGPNSESNIGPMSSTMMPHGNMMNSMNPSNSMLAQNSVGGPNSSMLPPHHMSSGPNSMHGNMMPGNMPPSNNMMGNSYAPNNMMPNNMGPNNNMMANNMATSNNNMLGNNMGPSNNNLSSNMNQAPQNESDSVSVQDPFADEPCASGPSYPRQSMNSQMPPYSGMQSQTTMSGNYGFNRQNAQHGMSPYSNMSQQSMNNFSENRIGQNEQYNDAYRRTMGMENFNNNNRNSENFGPAATQFGPRNSQVSGAQFPFGPQFDRERFEQPNAANSNQQFRPPSQPGMVTQQQHPEQMYPNRYGSNQQMTSVRSHTPQHDQYAAQGGYPNQSNTFNSPRGVVPQEQYQNYPNQQAGFAGHRPPSSREVPGGNMYGTPNKRYPPDVERRENFNMSGYTNQPNSYPEKPGSAPVMYPQYREAMIPPQDSPMHDSRRDPSQWSAMQQRYGSQHSGSNYPGSSMNAMPPGSGMLPPMVPPSPSSTGRTMNPRLSPQRDKPYMSPPRVQPGGMVPNAQLPPKKEISFPPDSVEAVQPLLAKRKRLAKQDIGQTEPWKLMMALKSGMLAESTWALDTLSILLFDDSTVAYFTLSHLPGLLEVLLEHFRRCLIDIFGLFNELEVGYNTAMLKHKEKKGAKSKETHMDVDDFKNLESDTVWKGMRTGENYTYITRQGKIVKINENDRDTALLHGKHWDVYTNFTSKAEHWQLGGGDMTKHVQTHFESLSNHKVLKKFFLYRGMKKNCEDDSINISLPESNCIMREPAEHASEEVRLLLKSTCQNNKTVNGVVEDNLPNCITKVHIKKEPVEEAEKNKAATKPTCTPADTEVSTAAAAAAASDRVKEEPRSEENCKNLDSEQKQSESTKNGTEKNCVNSENHCEKDGVVKKDLESQKVETKVDKDKLVKSEDKKTNSLKNESILSHIENGISIESLLRKAELCEDPEEEAFERDSPAVCLMSEAQDEIGRRCVCISNIFRSLSCIQGNDSEMSRHPGLMYILGKLLLLHHQHPPRVKVRRKLDKEETEFEDVSLSEHEWWWDHLHALRENTLVIFANICGQLDLSIYPEDICLPILNGLLHWAVCPSSCAQDPLPSMSPSSVLSPQRLVLEALCKLCIHEANVDLLLATPPFNRIVQLVNNLTKMLANKKEQVTQEFAVVLLSELVQGDSSAARAIAMQHPSVSLLIDFLETAEHNAVQVVSTHGINVLRDSPEMMGTSLDMLRRTANILVHLARVPENRPCFVHQQSRLLTLVMSQILDQHVAQTLADVLYECSHS
eukprot:XP_014790518.1 PREDICTED: trithorax group protein osa-like isoform X2 [Octopus bimaculoides]